MQINLRSLLVESGILNVSWLVGHASQKGKWRILFLEENLEEFLLYIMTTDYQHFREWALLFK